jgi:hypothetical protein
MKKIALIITCIFLTLSIFGQNNNSTCYALRVANKKYLSDTSLLQPKLYLEGFYVLTNGVYDFVINGKLYDHQRVLKITKDSIITTYAFDTIPSLEFTTRDKICIMLFQCYDGRCGFPNYTKVNDRKYQFEIIQVDTYCSLKAIEICFNSDYDIKYSAYQYLTGTDLLPIYRKDGEDFVIAGSVTHKIKRSNSLR